jgi:hypothetical protein
MKQATSMIMCKTLTGSHPFSQELRHQLDCVTDTMAFVHYNKLAKETGQHGITISHVHFP